MSELREQLASWFKAVHHRHEHGIGGPCEACAGRVPADVSANDMVWFVMAEGCLRQMEWARTIRGEVWRGDGRDGTRHLVDLDDEPLTLAPEGWKS